MTEFASNSDNVAALNMPADGEQGFAKCGGAGLEMSSANFNAILAYLCERIELRTMPKGGTYIDVNQTDPLNPCVDLNTAAVINLLCSNAAFRDCMVQALLADDTFREGIAQLALGLFQQSGNTLVIADGTDGSGNFTFTPCP